MPRRNLKLHALFRRREHAVAIGNRHDNIERERTRHVLDAGDCNPEIVFADGEDLSPADVSLAVGDASGVATIDSARARVLHR